MRAFLKSTRYTNITKVIYRLTLPPHLYILPLPQNQNKNKEQNENEMRTRWKKRPWEIARKGVVYKIQERTHLALQLCAIQKQTTRSHLVDKILEQWIKTYAETCWMEAGTIEIANDTPRPRRIRRLVRSEPD